MSGAVVVTGAAGSLGRHLCAFFARRGREVRALVRTPETFSLAGVRAGRCDLPGVLDESVLAGAAAVIHCAWATRSTDPDEARRVNEDGTRRVLDAARRARIPRLVFVSTIIAAPDAPSYYGRAKHALEALLDPTRDLVVRPGLILAREGHGLFQQMRDTIRRAHLVPVFDRGRQPLQTIHVDDLCDAIGRALDRDVGGALDVAEAEPLPLLGFLRMLADRLRVRCIFLPLPFGPVLAMVRAIETVGVPFPLRSESLLGLKALRAVPVEESLRRLDLRPRVAARSLDELMPTESRRGRA
jgi:nucleoside-diphosphate-sugar epimerase